MPCFAYCGGLGSLAGWHGDDFYTEGELGALDEAGFVQGEGAPASGSGSKHRGHHLEANPSVVN